MVKKRERKGGLSSDRQSNRTQSSEIGSPDVEPGQSHANASRKGSTIFFLLLFIVSPAISVIIYSRLKAPVAVADPNLPYVYQQGLVTTDVNYRDVLTEHLKVSSNLTERQFENRVLAYVTPWNAKGYDMAKKFHSKLTHISPVWYDLKSQGSKLTLEGRHNANAGWISELRTKSNIKILPRVVLEAIPKEYLLKKKQRETLIDLIIRECQEMDYDGMVLESWSRWANYGVLHDPEMRKMALNFLKQLGEAMHAAKLERKGLHHLQLVYVIGPPFSEEVQPHDFKPEDLRSLSNSVDGFSLMTYDFSLPHNPGPNAPLKWIRSTLKFLLGVKKKDPGLAGKIFVGINFYGNDFALLEGMGGGPILGREYISLLEQHRPAFQWEKKSAEHFFTYFDTKDVKHVVFYPTLISIALRLKEARSWGAGISIWEIGQVSDDGEIDYSVKPQSYDAKLDDKDELWAQKKRIGRTSDVVLRCPACFTTLFLHIEDSIFLVN